MESEKLDQIRSTGVRVLEQRFLRGPNIYAYMPVLVTVIDIGDYDNHPSSEYPELAQKLVEWLPGLDHHNCSLKRPGGFVERLKRGTYLAHITEHVALELQNVMSFPVTFGRARGYGKPGVFTIVVAYNEEVPAEEAFQMALWLSLAAMNGWSVDIERELDRMKNLADSYRLGPSTESIVRAARRRHIPVRRITPCGSLVQLGYGVHQKRIRASETSFTSAIAVDICQEKPLTNLMLKAVGVPVPDGRTVRSSDEAWAVAEEIGVPVVVKPEDGNQGKGVSVNLTGEAEIRSAFEAAHQIRGSVLVERYIEGIDHRLLVVNGKMIAAACRQPAQVIGDGEHSVEQLVKIANKDPRRASGHSASMTKLSLDPAADSMLAKQGLGRDSVPARGQAVLLRSNGNLSTGGSATDVTHIVHPRNAQVAELAAQIVNLDVAGVDVICKDITRPLGEQGGAIVEVNAAPGLRMHIEPASGIPRDVGEPIVDMLYPDGAPSRIPIIAITGTNGKTTVTRLIAHMFTTAHKCVGMTSTDGAYIAGEMILKGDSAGPQSARTILMHPSVEVAVLETARGGILREGLAFDACSVGVVTNVTEDHIGLRGINSLADLAKVKQVVVEAVARTGTAVLNADDRTVAEMAAATDGEVIYFSTDRMNPVVQAHLAGGGRCVLSESGSIVLAGGSVTTELVELERLPFTHGGRLRFQVQNALAAVAAAWGQNLNPALVARALSTFMTTPEMVPGRFNIFDVGGVEVIVDYAHNPAAMSSLGDAITELGRKRTYVVLTLPGDRRDKDLRATMTATLKFATDYILYEGSETRGRAPMEIPNLMQALLPPHARAEIASNFRAGMEIGWSKALPGERLVLIPDSVDEALASVHRMQHPESSEVGCDQPIREALAVA
jgi:cyanophycin synthetase